jgi:hypothetical protein
MYPRKGLMYLRRMAERGFAPVAKPKDPAVEMIVRSNIGGIVTECKSKVVGLDNTVWEDFVKNGLIPTSESARNLIAIEVLYFEKSRWWNRIRFWHRK